jgi:hypothetical protein
MALTPSHRILLNCQSRLLRLSRSLNRYEGSDRYLRLIAPSETSNDTGTWRRSEGIGACHEMQVSAGLRHLAAVDGV